MSFTAVVTAATATLNSEVLPGVVQEAVMSVHFVVVAVITLVAFPAKLQL